jgi:hypothetical protein
VLEGTPAPSASAKLVGADHTFPITTGIAHAFVAIIVLGALLAFLPKQSDLAPATHLAGRPPACANRR